jgi:glucose-6-phosphate isomerase
MITSDSSLLFSDKIGQTGLDQNSFSQNLDSLKNVNQKAQNNEYSFLNILKNHEIINQCRDVYQKTSQNIDHLIIVGIGGSDLGDKMLYQSLAKNNDIKITFLGSTTDPYPYSQVLKNLNPQKTLVNVISKSGGTLETAVGFLLLKNYFQQKLRENWLEHFIFTTNPEDGYLNNLARQNNRPALEIPSSLSGRFSILSSVGLFPALFMGIDIEKLINSANNYTQKLISDDSVEKPAWQIANSLFLLQQTHNLNNIVLMPYISRLETFAYWFRQLWAETIGKDGKGILPIKAIGPADQHSQIQFYEQGKHLNSYIFISAQNYDQNLTITNQDITDLDYLHNKNLQHIIQTECKATRFSLAKSGRPSLHLQIDQLNEQSIGELIILFELATTYFADLINVNNPFDQPGVEQGKNYIYSMLGREGFEHFADELKKYE